ncbi:MAG: hypothetical protein Q9227_008986 [Pyrenula ochraceoflavens]
MATNYQCPAGLLPPPTCAPPQTYYALAYPPVTATYPQSPTNTATISPTTSLNICASTNNGASSAPLPFESGHRTVFFSDLPPNATRDTISAHIYCLAPDVEIISITQHARGGGRTASVTLATHDQAGTVIRKVSGSRMSSGNGAENNSSNNTGSGNSTMVRARWERADQGTGKAGKRKTEKLRIKGNSAGKNGWGEERNGNGKKKAGGREAGAPLVVDGSGRGIRVEEEDDDDDDDSEESGKGNALTTLPSAAIIDSTLTDKPDKTDKTDKICVEAITKKMKGVQVSSKAKTERRR